MIAHIHPTLLSGTIPAIASKSVAHRLIIVAALANGDTHIKCNTTCADIDATIRCLTALGAKIDAVDDGFMVKPMPKSVAFGLLRALHHATLDCGESGSTLRFMLPVACALGAEATFIGSGRLGERPLSPLSEELIAAGCELEGLGGFPLKTSGRIRPGRFELPSEIVVNGRIESRPYINLTIQAMQTFGVDVYVDRRTPGDGTEVTVFTTEDDTYRTPHEATVEGDWSNAAFWLCAGALGRLPIKVDGLSLSSAQGDRNVLAALSRFGARIGRSTDAAISRPDKLCGFEMSAKDIPDLVPIIAAVASVAEGRTVITDCARLRIKESDRLATVAKELSNLGAQIQIKRDALIIDGVPQLIGGTVDSHNDHRIAMMAAIAASRCENDVYIKGAEAVNKSYPLFFDHYQELGGMVELTQE